MPHGFRLAVSGDGFVHTYASFSTSSSPLESATWGHGRSISAWQLPASASSAHVPLFQVSGPPFCLASALPLAHTNQSSNSVMIGSTVLRRANSQLVAMVEFVIFLNFYFLHVFQLSCVKSTEDFTQPSIALRMSALTQFCGVLIVAVFFVDSIALCTDVICGSRIREDVKKIFF